VQFAPWAAVFLAGVAGGIIVCAAMVVPRDRLWWTTLLGAVAAIAVVASCATVWHAAARVDALIAAAFIALGSCAGGYALASSLVATFTRPRAIRSPIPRTGATDDRLHVVLLADAEPETYGPGAVTVDLERFEAAEVPLPPDIARPLVYASERSRYHVAAGSPARAAARDTADALAERLIADGVDADVRVAFCDGDSTLAEVVAELAADGAHRIVIAGLTVAWSRSFETAVAEAADLGASAAGLHLEVTDPLWASPHIAAMVARRALSALDPDPSANGIVLVSAGQPWEWGRDDPAAAEQTTYFAQRVRAELIEAGLTADRVRHAWLEWEDPDVSETVRHLAAVGARRIALVPATFPLESIATVVDLHAAAERAAVETDSDTVVACAWGNDPSVIESLVEAIRAAMARIAG
jgi:protoheme ferro-lyase